MERGPLLREQVSFEEEVVAALQQARDLGLTELDDAELERRLRVAAAEVAAATCRWLLLLAEAVRRGIWATQGARTPTQWLSYLVSIAESTAREHVRVALRLRDLPRVTAVFAAGRLSYSKVRAITRMDCPELEELLLTYCEYATGEQLERIVAELRRTDRVLTEEAEDPWDRRGLDWSLPGDGTARFEIVLPMDVGLEAMALLRAQSESESRAALADAVVAAIRVGADAVPTDDSGADRTTLVIHAHADDLADQGDAQERVVRVRARVGEHPREPAMSVKVLRKLACDARYAVVGHDDGGDVAGVSGTTRRIPSRLRRLLLERDRHCRFPGCSSTRWLHAHHIIHVADGGPTTACNLVLLCGYHHHVVHDRGWTILHDGQGRFRFRESGGQVAAPVAPPSSASAEALDLLDDGRDTYELRARWDGTRPDYDAAVAALQAAITRARAPEAAVAA